MYLVLGTALLGTVPRGQPLTEEDLRNWKLLDDFQVAISRVFSSAQLHPTFSDPQRKLTYGRYLSLFLFGLYNPVVKTMRGLCACSELPRVQEEVCGDKVSLGSFSETQALLNPNLLHEVFRDLSAQLAARECCDTRLAHLNLVAQDGSLWSALPRMGWAEYGVGQHGRGKGVRLHLRLNIHDQAPVDARIDIGKSSETKALRQMCEPGQTTVGDRLYGGDYKLFEDIDRAQASFVFRLRDTAVIHLIEEIPLTDADRAVGVVRHAWVYLGATDKLRSMKVRLVEVRAGKHHLLLVTNLPIAAASAELVSIIYRRRWSIELFFRWIKCILGCRHFFAESREGAAIQIYLALIASVLLQLWVGRRPDKRMMELIQLYQLGWATIEDVERRMGAYAEASNKIKKA